MSALTPETGTTRAQSWLATHDIDDCAISDWVVAEFSAALSMKVRSGDLLVRDRASVLSGFARWVAGSFVVLEVARTQFRTAARFADHIEFGVRGSDALHLAICADHGATLCTMDRRLAAAAPALGVVAQLV